jgi:hypothetical protein
MAGQSGTPSGACVEPEPPVNVTAAAADPPYRGHEPVRLVLVPSARTLRSAVTVVAPMVTVPLGADGAQARDRRRTGRAETRQRGGVGHEGLEHRRGTAVGITFTDDMRLVGELDETAVAADLGLDLGYSGQRRPGVEGAAEDEHRQVQRQERRRGGDGRLAIVGAGQSRRPPCIARPNTG